MLGTGGGHLDVYRLFELVRLRISMHACLLETCEPPALYRYASERVGTLTLVEPEGVRPPPGPLPRNITRLSIRDIASIPERSVDTWLIFDPVAAGIPGPVPEAVALTLKGRGRVILLEARSLRPGLDLVGNLALLVSAGLAHVGGLDVNPHFRCEVLTRR